MSTYYVAGLPYSDELYHHGIKGQKWGIRRYQNPDGTLTTEGRIKYGEDGRSNSVRKHLASRYNMYSRSKDRQLRKADKARFKGKDPAKYIKRAKNFEKSAKMYETMSKNYENLDIHSQRGINYNVAALNFIGGFFGGAIGAGIAALSNEQYLRERLAH